MKQSMLIAVSLALMAGPTLKAETDWKSVGEGRLEIKNADRRAPEVDAHAVVPLRHTDVHIRVQGFVAEATVTQRFENVLDRPIEAEYVFPLPHDAAVNATEMHIGDRIIRGRVDRRETARQAYEDAKVEGRHTSLLEQERPNIFTQSVANIGPGETIEIMIRYVQPLPYTDGSYELVFPMVVGPRYMPGLPLGQESGRAQVGRGREPDTDQVPDASRISPPALKPRQRCGFDIDIQVDMDAGVPLGDVRSRSHAVTIQRTGETTALVALDDADRIPNKDFVLQIDVAGKQPEVGVLAHHDGQGGYFMLVLQPPKTPTDHQIRPRELILVLDRSGSMWGQPITLAKRAMEQVLRSLRPEDTFNIVSFSIRADSFQPAPVAANAQNVQAGIGYVRSLTSGGGTKMMTGVLAALSSPPPEGYLRIITLFTDGYIGNESAIIGAVQRLLGSARVFPFGVGWCVNRYLLDRMAIAGRGTAQYILLNDSPEEAIDSFVDRMSRPVLTDVSLEFGDVCVRDLSPSPVPDVYAGKPVYIYGRYDEPAEGVIEVVGRIGIQPRASKVQVHLPGPADESSPLPSIWARQRIKELELVKLGSPNPISAEQQITQLALNYSLMSAYTSFVAIDETPSLPAVLRPQYVQVSVPMPEGVQYETTINEAASRGPRGGGPIGPLGLAIVGVMAIAEWRRRKGGRCRH